MNFLLKIHLTCCPAFFKLKKNSEKNSEYEKNPIDISVSSHLKFVFVYAKKDTPFLFKKKSSVDLRIGFFCVNYLNVDHECNDIRLYNSIRDDISMILYQTVVENCSSRQSYRTRKGIQPTCINMKRFIQYD